MNPFEPRRVAVIGASDGGGDDWSFKARVTRAVLGSALDEVVLVNPSVASIDGHAVVPSLADAPAKTDTAVVVVPPSALPGVVADCSAHGVDTCLVVTAGVGEEGRASLVAARAAGMRVLGPNCIGFLDHEQGVRLFAGGTLPQHDPGPSPVAVVTQSGGFASGVIARANDAGLGISQVFTTGEELDVGLEDCLEHVLERAAARAVVLFIETIRRPRRFRCLARRARAQGVPLLALRIGRTAVARTAALAHTGALVDDWAATDAALRCDGVLTCRSVQEVVDVASVVAGRCSSPTPGVEIVSSSGALGALAADLATDHDLPLVPPARSLAARLPKGPPPDQRNPLDTSTVGSSAATLRLLVEAARSVPSDDPSVVLFCHTGATYGDAVAAELVRLRGAGPATVVAAWPGAGPEATAALRAGGVAWFDDADRALAALGAVDRWARHEPVGDLAGGGEPVALSGGDGELMGYVASRELLGGWGVAGPRFVVVAGGAPVDRGALAGLRFPVVAKVAEGLNHKAAAGGVVLGIGSVDELVAAVERLRSNGHCGAVVVEEQVGPGTEVLVDVRRSPFGDVLTVGWGGSATEQLGDVASTCAPFTAESVAAALATTRVARRLRAVQPDPAGGEAALVSTCLRLAQAFASAAELLEVEVNPVIVEAERALAADARVIRRAGGEGA